MVSDGVHHWVIVDGGRRAQVLQLGADCGVQAVIAGDVDPYDVEDVARAPDGTFWLADLGDNDHSRPTVAVITLTPAGQAHLYRMSYPDGPHDAEALLLGNDGAPLVVTKEISGVAGVYRPDGLLVEPGPTPLRRVGEVRLPASDTVGGPVGATGSTLVTGAATGPDGRLAVLRTYTDAWLFPAPDGDLLAALGRPPVRVPLPGEPQGEAVAITPDGTLLSGSESLPGKPGQLRAVAAATALVATEAPAPDPAAAPATAAADSKVSTLQGVLVALFLAVVLVFGFGRIRKKR